MKDDVIYTRKRDDAGEEYYCPLTADQRRARHTDARWEDCVEVDVVERYSGQINRNATHGAQ